MTLVGLVVRANEQDIKHTKEETMAKVPVYHSIDDEENKIIIDIHEIKNACVEEMEKKYPDYDVEVVEVT
mgnify:CR=1 FL=1